MNHTNSSMMQSQEFVDSIFSFLSRNMLVIMVAVIILFILLIPIIIRAMQTDEWALGMGLILCSAFFFLLLFFGVYKGNIEIPGFTKIIKEIGDAVIGLVKWLVTLVKK